VVRGTVRKLVVYILSDDSETAALASSGSSEQSVSDRVTWSVGATRWRHIRLWRRSSQTSYCRLFGASALLLLPTRSLPHLLKLTS